MQNKSLANDYITRCEKRLKAIDTLFKEESWADVVRESQEAVELALKALLRFANVEYPRLHDVSGVLEAEKKRLPKEVHKHLDKMIRISRELRRDRELSFYGSEDLTPSEFYKKEDAVLARDNSRWLVELLAKIID